MGVWSKIQELKDKVRRGTGNSDKESDDYIPVENLNANVQVYREPSVREKIANAKGYVKQKIAERQVYRKEREALETQKLKDENAKLRLQNQNVALKRKREKLEGAQPLSFAGFARAVGKGATPMQSKQIGNGQVFGSTGFRVDEQPKPKKGSNVFGGTPPFG